MNSIDETQLPEICVTNNDNDDDGFDETDTDRTSSGISQLSDSSGGLESNEAILRRNESFNSNISDKDDEYDKSGSNRLEKIKSVFGIFKRKDKSNSIVLRKDLFYRPIYAISVEYHKNLAVFKGLNDKDVRLELKNGKLHWDYCGEYIQDVDLTQLISIVALRSTRSTEYPMEISWISTGNMSLESHIFTAPNCIMREIWMQQIFESTCNCFPKYLTNIYSHAGWTYIKEGVSGEWRSCWALLKDREINFCYANEPTKDADLRKARCILPQIGEGLDREIKCVWLDLQERSIYIQSICEKETNRWGRSIRSAAVNNGTALEESQLTKDNLPVLVEKCINFISRKGLLSQGIYIKDGREESVRKLLKDLQAHAWECKVIEDMYTEHDVATALKYYFKHLPTRLIKNDVASNLCGIACVNYSDEEEKIKRYRFCIQQLSSIHFITLKKLLAHLYFLQLMSSKNLATLQKMAKIWMPILILQRTGIQSTLATQCIIDLIEYYPKIFEITQNEMQKELEMLNRMAKLNSYKVPESGDLRLWICIGKPGANEMKQILVGPQKIAGEVCNELKYSSEYKLHEYILSGALRRPLHTWENVFDVVVRWGYWNESDRKDNQLVLAPSNLKTQSESHLSEVTTIEAKEFKFANSTSNNFKNYTFTLRNDSVECYKESKMITKLFEWKIKEYVWYIGSEPKRDPNTNWSITFVSKNERQPREENKYFGNIIAGKDHNDFINWATTIFYKQNLL